MINFDTISPVVLIHVFSLAGSVVSIAQKLLLTKDMNLIELMMLRNFGVSIIIFLLMGKERRKTLFTFSMMNKKEQIIFWLRNIVGFFLVITHVGAFMFLPTSTVTIIYNMKTFFGSFFAFLIVREPIYLIEIICISVSFFGVSLIFVGREEGHNAIESHWLSYLLPISAAAFGGLYVVLTRYLKNLDTCYSLFWVTFSEVWVNLPIDLLQIFTGKGILGLPPSNWQNYSFMDYFSGIFVVGGMLTIAAFCTLSAFARAKTGSIIMLV